MIIRTSANLAKKIHVSPVHSFPLDCNPFADWSARLFTANRAQYIVVTNTTSLYSVVMHGRGITDDSAFIQRTVAAIREQLAEDNLPFLFERHVAPETARVTFSKFLSPSVTGSLNNIATRAKYYLANRGLSPLDTARMLARLPMGSLGYAFPFEVFTTMSMKEQ